MKAIRILNHLIVLDNITRVTFEQNDVNITADNQCGIFFVGSGTDPMVFRGEEAMPAYDQIAKALGIEPQESG